MRQDEQSINPMNDAIFFRFLNHDTLKYVTSDGGVHILDVEDENDASNLCEKFREIIKRNLPKESWVMDYINNVDKEFQIRMGKDTEYLKVSECTFYKVNNRYLVVTAKKIYKVYVEKNEDIFAEMIDKIEICK